MNMDQNISSFITGQQLRRTGDNALVKLVSQAGIFAEIEPEQKERIIIATEIKLVLFKKS